MLMQQHEIPVRQRTVRKTNGWGRMTGTRPQTACTHTHTSSTGRFPYLHKPFWIRIILNCLSYRLEETDVLSACLCFTSLIMLRPPKIPAKGPSWRQTDHKTTSQSSYTLTDTQRQTLKTERHITNYYLLKRKNKLQDLIFVHKTLQKLSWCTLETFRLFLQPKSWVIRIWINFWTTIWSNTNFWRLKRLNLNPISAFSICSWG